MDLKSLKSGSDIRGVAIEGNGFSVQLTDEAVKRLTIGYEIFLSKLLKKSPLKIAVGQDSRLSGDRIIEAVRSTLKKGGCEIYDCGMCSTPSMFMMTKYEEVMCDGSIMVTASHHPSNKNGLKFFIPKGGITAEQLDEIINYAESDEDYSGKNSKLFKKDFLKWYCDALVKKIRDKTNENSPLKGMKIVVDAGNGCGGFFVDRVLKPLGADTAGSQYLEPNGSFPNHIPNPEDPQAMQAIKSCVLNNKADLGIIFDTDVDRSAIVSKSGLGINSSRLIALVSKILLEEHPGATIVTDSITSDGLNKFILANGGIHHRFKRGYNNVISEAERLTHEGKNVPIAIETSGHAAFKENYFLDDGSYLIARLLIKAAQLKKQNKNLEDLLDGLENPLEEREVRLSFRTNDWKNYGNIIIKKLSDYALLKMKPAISNYEGIRANIPIADGWFLVRMSVHDPIMPINIESNKKGGCKMIAKILYAYLSAYSKLDCTNLKLYIES